MNDFTKTELQEINRCIKYMISGGTTPYSCLTIAINKKLRNMIDNYCVTFECEYCHSLRNIDSPNAFCCGEYHE